MNPNKVFRRFADAVAHAPAGAQLTIGLMWIATKGWRVMMAVDTAVLHVGVKEARGLADIYDREHRAPAWRGKTTGLEWVAPELRKLADEAADKNAAGDIPRDYLDVAQPSGSA